MMKVYRWVILAALGWLMVVDAARAQYDVVFSHYFDMQSSFNPAATGKESKLNVNVAYAMQMAGYEHNPQTAYASADMPIKGAGGINGLGLMLMNDKLGLFNHQRLEGQYSYHRRLGKGMLGIGVQAGLLSEKFSGSELDLGDSNDPAFSTSDLDGNTLDVGAGVYLKFPKWYVGLSAQHITYPTVSLGEYNELKLDGTYYLTGGYDIQLANPTMKIATSALVRTDLVGYRADITGRWIYTHDEKMMYAGIGYSPMNSVTAYVGMQFQGIVLGYSFEAYTNNIGIQHGSHELHIGYLADIDLNKKGRNRHQSVRYL